MPATILNTDANINAKTVMAAENAETVTGLKTYDRDPNPPFAVSAGSAVVPNLDADKLDGLEAVAFIKIDGTTSMTGKLNLGTNGQVQFPASQNASADINCLDDYEEGTWVPVATSSGGGAPTYSAQAGFYTKIGREVKFYGRITLATIGTLAAGNFTITGLPLAAQGTGNFFGGCSFTYWGAMTTAIVTLQGTIAAATTVITIRHAAAAAAALLTTQISDISGLTDLIFYGSYQTA